MLVGKLFEQIDDHTSAGAVVNVDGRRTHPRLKVEDRERNVLRVHLQQNARFRSCPPRGIDKTPKLEVGNGNLTESHTHPVEDPYLPVGRGFGNSVAVIVKQNTFLLGVPS